MDVQGIFQAKSDSFDDGTENLQILSFKKMFRKNCETDEASQAGFSMSCVNGAQTKYKAVFVPLTTIVLITNSKNTFAF